MKSFRYDLIPVTGKKLLLIFFIPVFFSVSSFAYNPVKNGKDTTLNFNGWYFGINLGSYFASRKTANYYNGSGRINNLNNAIINNVTNHDSLVNRFGHEFYIDTSSLPQNMRYDPAINIGIHLRKMFRNQLSLFFEMNYSRLKTTNIAVIYVEDYSAGFMNPDYYQATLLGEEDRYDFNIGLSKEFLKKKISPFASFGIDMNNVKVVKSQVQVQGMVIDLESPYYAMYNVRQGGVGFGVFGCIGIDAKFGKNGMMNLGWNLSYKRINLTDESETPLFNSVIYVQILVNAASWFRNKNDK